MRTKGIILLVLILSCISGSGFSQTRTIRVQSTVPNFNPATELPIYNNSNNPPGTLKVKNFYVDRSEILNIDWLEFLHHKRKELDSLEMLAILPDTSNYWYTYRENWYKPIVLITYEQANEYCKWRSEVVSRLRNQKITYRLPTPDEWKEIATEQLLNDRKRIDRELTYTLKKIKRSPDNYLMIENNKRSDDRIYHLFDNVSEMTTEKSVALGANNNQLSSIDVNLKRVITYESPSVYLGFRCIAEVE